MALNDSPLGHSSPYPAQYDPTLLFAVPREEKRRRLGLDEGYWPWGGGDIWQAWELSWIQPGGVPAVAWGVFRVPCVTPFIIESKSLKLYLNSLNQTRFSDREQLRTRLESDLSRVAGGQVTVQLYSVDEPVQIAARPDGAILVDDEPVAIERYDACPEALVSGESVVSERLCSHLLKSNCPVTGQPDWATLVVDYTGPAIDRAGLLRYVIGYRQQQDFHEHCVESVFVDILERCRPERLTVSAHYTRRGGLDINPWRSTDTSEATRVRLVRQ